MAVAGRSVAVVVALEGKLALERMVVAADKEGKPVVCMEVGTVVAGVSEAAAVPVVKAVGLGVGAMGTETALGIQEVVDAPEGMPAV